LTGISIPECSCAACLTEQIRRYAPARLLQRDPGAAPPRAA